MMNQLPGGEPLYPQKGEKKISIVIAGGRIRNVINLPDGWEWNIITFGAEEDMLLSMETLLEESRLTTRREIE